MAMIVENEKRKEMAEACRSHNGFIKFSGNRCTVKTYSSSGVPLIVDITPDKIQAYRAERANVTKTTISDEGITIEEENELSDYFNSKPVMDIDRRDNDNFSVDFEAGFQRGWFTGQGRKEMCDRLPSGYSRINTKQPWLEWIGLSCKDKIVKMFVDGEL